MIIASPRLSGIARCAWIFLLVTACVPPVSSTPSASTVAPTPTSAKTPTQPLPSTHTVGPIPTSSAPSSEPQSDHPLDDLLTLVADSTGDLDEFRLVDGAGKILETWDVFTRTSGAFNYYVGYPSLSPNGRWLAVTKADDVTESFVVDLTTREILGPYYLDPSPDWSPDSLRLAFTQNGRVGILDLATGNQVFLTEGVCRDPQWDPSGTRIAYYQTPADQADVGFVAWSYELHVIDVDGGHENTIAANALLVTNDVDISEANGGFGPAWSADGQAIAYVSGELSPDGAAGPTGMDISVVSITNNTIHTIVSQIGNDGSPSWSPDGTQIAFVNTREGRAIISIADTQAGAIRPLSPTTGDMEYVSPIWSFNGQWIAMGTIRGERPPSVAIVRPDGSGFQVVAPQSVDYQKPIWVKRDSLP